MPEKFIEYLPFFIPLFILQFSLAITSVIHVLRHKTYRFGNRIMWVIVCAIVSIIGPVIYFVLGKGED